MNWTGVQLSFVTMILTAVGAFAAPSISDSLVQNLKCDQLTPQNVLSFIPHRKAFSSDQHVQIPNWDSGVLQNCWGLARAQRKFFYLIRTDATQNSPSLSLVNYALDLARGSSRAKNCDSNDSSAFCSDVRTPLRVIPIQESKFSSSRLLQKMVHGVQKPLERNFKTEIEYSQQNRFFDLSNLHLVFENHTLNRERNQALITKIRSLVSWGRMPMLVLRLNTMSQHVVLVKGIIEVQGGSRLVLYDSQEPFDDRVLEYQDGIFYGNRTALGVTLVDEDGMDEIQLALYQHYSALCGHQVPQRSR